mmetsp:Transcript_32849/g.82494  ORF Transcript_32849/g.82494 Transcript_32849/m.82494 type:complete len:696 (+) Transcript_32849:175-2262(+)
MSSSRSWASRDSTSVQIERGHESCSDPTQPFLRNASFSSFSQSTDGLNIDEDTTAFDGDNQEPSQCQLRKHRIDMVFFRKLVSLFGLLFRLSRQHARHWLLFVGLIALILVNTVVVSQTGSVIGGFYTALENQDRSMFFSVLGMSSVILLASALLDSTIKFITSMLAYCWRETMTHFVHSKYFEKMLYYNVTHLLDNPDQRITQDVENWTSTAAVSMSKVLTAPLVIILYTGLSAYQIAWYAPLIVYAYFFVGVFVNRLIMNPIVQLVFQQGQLEGNFRYAHVRIRTSAEAIALYGGQEKEKKMADARFRQLLKNKFRVLRWHWGLTSTSNLFSYLGTLVNYTIIALPVMFISPYHPITAGEVAKFSFTIIMLTSGFSDFINISDLFSDLAGYTSRIADLLEVLTDLQRQDTIRDQQEENSVFIDEDKMAFDTVSCFTPKGRLLIRDLSFCLPVQSSLLIMGPSGSGKTAVLRILSGLWKSWHGSVFRPHQESGVENSFRNRNIVYLPQVPYLTNGSLAENIIYPLMVDDRTALPLEQMEELLERVHLRSLMKRVPLYSDSEQVASSKALLSNIKSWTELLSPGEQQLLSFARLFYHCPKFAVLDEATSSLPPETEMHLYQQCKNMGLTVLSVGHRVSLLQFHDFLLRVSKDTDSWTFTSLKDSSDTTLLSTSTSSSSTNVLDPITAAISKREGK